jgi:hypothetical protein
MNNSLPTSTSPTCPTCPTYFDRRRLVRAREISATQPLRVSGTLTTRARMSP